jgi:hypothetical protein
MERKKDEAGGVETETVYRPCTPRIGIERVAQRLQYYGPSLIE